MRSNLPGQCGQAVVEFVVGVGVLVLFLIVIPVFGNLFEIRLRTIEAADYVLWRKIKQGIKESDAISSMQIESRFFSYIGQPITTAKSAAVNSATWAMPDGQPLVKPGSIRVKSATIAEDIPGAADRVRSAFDLPSSGIQQASVTVRLSVSEQYEWLSAGMKIQQHFAGIGNTWVASGPPEIIRHTVGAHEFHPYPVAQKGVVHTVNGLLDLIFGEVKLRTNLIRPDIVPADRLEVYVE